MTLKAITTTLLLIASSVFTSLSQETETLYLSGKGFDTAVEWEFFCTDGRRSGEWTTIPVPSNWELHGFGNYNYGHDNPKHDEKGLYRYRFNVPADWKGKNVIIVFEGSMTDTEVKINGELAGERFQGGFYRFSYDISRLLKPGTENLLEVTVSKVSADSSVEQAERQGDYWVFGGIYRPVYLQAYPSEYIGHTAIDAGADGTFLANVYTGNIRRAASVEAQIMTLNGEAVGEPFSAQVSRGQAKVTLNSKADNIKTWSPEFPDLYQVELRLRDNRGIIHSTIERFGFRTIEVIKGNGIYVNGEKIKFRGVNRHSFWPESGRALSEELNIADVNLMKDMNMNAVRMSHYPPDRNFIEACDSLGLFVINELAGWQRPPYDTGIGRVLIESMVKRDVNSPSIIFWANGNEGGGNHELDDDFAVHDPQNRPVIHPWKLFRGLDTQHYKPWNYGTGELFTGRDIFLPTEFLHGLYDGGHGAGLEDFWRIMWDHPLSAGGFLWVFSDEGVVRTDKDGWIDTDGDHAPDGILGPYRVWKNRLRGQQFGVWHKDYNNTVTGESWDYPEFKGYHAETYWAVIETTEVPVTVVTASNDLFFRMLTPERPQGALQDHTSPPFPDGDISFLYGISAIGTKFHSADRLGPQSQQIRQWWTLEPNQRINLFFRFGE